MALRAGYWGIKKLLSPLKLFRPGELGIDQDALAEDLNSVFFTRTEQAALGSKNLFVITRTNADTVRGVVFTPTPDYVKAEGTNDGSGTAYYGNLNNFYNGGSIKNGKYVLNAYLEDGTLLTGATGFVFCNRYTAGGTQSNAGDTAVKNEVEITFDFSAYARYELGVAIKSGITIDSNIYIMLRLATDPNPSFVPYAMTNEQLTASAADQKTTINAIITAATGAADFAAFKTAMGAITPVTRSIQVTPETREEEPVKKTTRKKSTAKADTEKGR